MEANELDVLLIEDDPEQVELIEAFLERAGNTHFRLEWVSRLSHAIERLAEVEFSVVLLDLALPDSEGIETFLQVRDHAHGTPLVILTGWNDEAMAVRAVQEGAQDYLVKTEVTDHVLLRSIRYAVERSQAIAALRESEERFRLLAEHAQDVIFRFELFPRLRLSYISPAIEPMLGYTPDEAHADPDLHLKVVHPGDRSALIEMMSNQRDRIVATLRWLHKDGRTVWGEMHNVPVVNDGRLVAVEGILRDVTQRQTMEERLLRAQRLEMAGQLAGQIAHDFNNLLGPLVWYPELIKAELPREHPAVSYCDDMLRAALRIAEINQDLLTLGRRGQAQMEPLDLTDVIEDAVASAGDVPAGIQISLELAPEPLILNGSAAQLVRVVTNLVANAREAMPGGGHLTVRTEKVTVGASQSFVGRPDEGHIAFGDYVCLTVSDTGRGFTADLRERIFDPFFSTKRDTKGRGAGLGLSVVQAIVADHGGHVEVVSEPGRGSAFHVYLPWGDGLTPRDTVNQVRGGTETILIVDDDEMQRKGARNVLRALGYQVEVATSGEEAAQFLAEHAVDLVILDMVMPGGIDGTETYRQMKQIRPGQPTIILSGFAETERMRQTLELGVCTHVHKPVRVEDLARVVRAELDQHHPKVV